MKILKTYKRKLRINKTNQQRFAQWIGTSRLVYNLGLELKIMMWQTRKTSISKFDLIKQLPELKKEYDWIADVNAQVLQQTLDRLDKSYQSFFRGNGFPRFAKKGKFNSIIFPQSVTIEGNILKLPKIGYVKIFNRNTIIPNKIKRATVTKEIDGFFVSLLVEEELPESNPSDKQVGIDVGITYFATLTDSDGKTIYISNPRVTRTYERKLRIANRALARTKKGSKNRRKRAVKVGKLHKKIANIRNDFLHKESRKIVNKYGHIFVEDLKVKNMIKFGKLSKHIADVSWSRFFDLLEYKQEWNGGEMKRIDPKYTSQKCSNCGHTEKENRQTQSKFVCKNCGLEINADKNASINILSSGADDCALTYRVA